LSVAYQALLIRGQGASDGSQVVRRFSITAAPAVLLKASQNRDFAISPDGKRIAYFARLTATLRQLHVRALDELESKPLHSAEQWYEPFFSPDGKWIAFTDESDYTLKKISVTGGPVVPIARSSGESLGAVWSDDQMIVFSTVRSGLSRVSAEGGTPTVLTTLNKARGEVAHAWPIFVPSRHAVLYTIVLADAQQIGALDLDSGEQRVIVQVGTAPHLLGDSLIYGVEDSLRAVRFDARRVDVVGEPVDLMKGIVAKGNGSMDFTVAADGTLAYVPGLEARRDVYWVDRLGARNAIGLPPNGYIYARLSPDGSKIALDARGSDHGIVIWNIARGAATRLPSDAPLDGQPIWMPDSTRIVFTSQRKGVGDLYVQAVDGSGSAEQIVTSQNQLRAYAVSKDGDRLIFSEPTATGHNLKTVRIAGGGQAEHLPATNRTGLNAALSPDGDLIAYQSDDVGRSEIFLRRFPETERDVLQVSTAGGVQPAWAGHELFYVSPNYKLMSVLVTQAGLTFRAAIPTPVIDVSQYLSGAFGRAYDVAPDGKRFLFVEAEHEGDPTKIVVVVNWQQELRRAMSKGK
jgi:Tol biopolymer transport system component